MLILRAIEICTEMYGRSDGKLANTGTEILLLLEVWTFWWRASTCTETVLVLEVWIF